jgi:oxygen-independent coproporphyrinogen-3 oxidase
MGDNLASLYIHIPFCAKRCGYCDFYSLPVGLDRSRNSNNDSPSINSRRDTPADSIINRYADALIKEWNICETAGMLDGRDIDTIHIGGGTPSLLGIDVWEKLDRELFSRIDMAGVKEWSVECNPESFNMDKARAYSKSGVTRLTFGIQSLNDRELSLCGRIHDSARALTVISDTRLPALFDSIGVDIIYGLPDQTTNTLNGTLASILSIPHIKHLSAYELTIATGTPFYQHEKTLPLPSDDTVAEMYDFIGKRCVERGMRQYEVSNYAFAGHESAHNRAYWSRKPYIGLGASAHSYIHPKRWGNVCDADKYISSLSSGDRPTDFEEVLTDRESTVEKVFLGLRNIEGIDRGDLGNRLREYVDAGYLIDSGDRLIPTSKGMLFADMIAREII